MTWFARGPDCTLIPRIRYNIEGSRPADYEVWNTRSPSIVLVPNRLESHRGHREHREHREHGGTEDAIEVSLCPLCEALSESCTRTMLCKSGMIPRLPHRDAADGSRRTAVPPDRPSVFAERRFGLGDHPFVLFDRQPRAQGIYGSCVRNAPQPSVPGPSSRTPASRRRRARSRHAPAFIAARRSSP